MKIRHLLFLLLFFATAIYAKEIELKNLLVITPDMSSNEIKELLEKMPDNTLVDWRTGSYKFDALVLANKTNISIEAEKDTTVSLNHLVLNHCDTMRMLNFILINTDDTLTVTVRNSSSIAFVGGKLASKDKKNGGMEFVRSNDIFVLNMKFVEMNEANLIRSESSTISVASCDFKKKQGKHAIFISSNSNVEIYDSNFSTENTPVLDVEKSRGLIFQNRFSGNKSLTTYFLTIRKKSHFTIANNTFSNFFIAMVISGSSAVKIFDNKITDGHLGFIITEFSKAIIDNNSFLNINAGDKPRGIYIKNNSYSEITDNVIENTWIGITGINSRMIIANNRLKDISDTGMAFFDGSNPYVTVLLKGNQFENVKEPYYGDDKTAVTLETDYDKFENYFHGTISQKIPVKRESIDLKYKEIDLTNLNTLINAKYDPKTANYLNPKFYTGKLVDDLIAGDTVIDAGEFVKIDKLTKRILYPKEYKGIKLDELPKLQSTDSQYTLTASVTTEGKLSDVHFMLTTADTLKSIKYKGKKEIRFIQKSNPDTGEEKYLFSFKLKNSDKQRSLSFITLDGKEVIKKFIFNDGTFQLIDNNQKKADF